MKHTDPRARQAARNCSEKLKAKFGFAPRPTPKQHLESEIAEAVKDGESPEYVAYLTAKLEKY